MRKWRWERNEKTDNDKWEEHAQTYLQAISAAALSDQKHDILQSPLLTGQTVTSPTHILEGKQWIKIITEEVGAESDRPFMIRDDQRVGFV